MFLHFENFLKEKKAPYTILKGDHKQRMKKAQEIIKALSEKNDF